MDDSIRFSFKLSWLMPFWARSTYGCYPCHHCTASQDTHRPAEGVHETGCSVFQEAGGLLTQRSSGIYFFKCCTFSSGLAGHLVLVLPELTDLRHTIAGPSFLSKAAPALCLVIPKHTLMLSPTHWGPLSFTSPLHTQPMLLSVLLRGCCNIPPIATAKHTAHGTSTSPSPHERDNAVTELSPLRTVVWQDEQLLRGKSAPLWLTWKLVQ